MGEISVDDAVAALVRQAEKHESEHESEFCDDTRVALVVFVMLHLGLDMDHLGAIAEGYIGMTQETGEDEGTDEQVDDWPEKIGDGH